MHPTSVRPTVYSWISGHAQPSHEPAPMLVATRLFHRRGRARTLAACLLVGLAVLLLTATRAGAVAPENGESMIAAQQFLGAAARDGVVVRSGASVGDLSVTTLSNQEEVVVVGFKNGFLRILPPEGTFCLISKADVNVRGETGGERVGRVTDNASVRVGSTLNQALDTTPLRLSAGEEVSVIGEDSVYYRIAPPKGVFFYVSQNDLLRVREVKVTETSRGWKVGELPKQPEPTPQVTQTPTTPTESAGNAAAEAADPTANLPTGDDDGEVPLAENDPDTEASPAEPETDVPAIAEAPTTRPAVLARFQEIDSRYSQVAEKPLEEQPLEELKTEYQTVLEMAKSDPAGAGIVPVIEARLETIQIRQSALQDLMAIQAMREQMAQRQQALQAEQQELAARAEQANVVVYAAVGQVQPSSLQIGGASLFRLCDPANGRTVIYLRADGEVAKDITGHLEEFVGVQGEVTEDEDLNLTFIKVTEVKKVDSAEVFDTVAAEMIPPSLVQSVDAGE